MSPHNIGLSVSPSYAVFLHYMSVQDKPSRLWRLAVATHPRTQQIEYELQVPQSGTYTMKPTASCEAAQLWVRATPPPKYSSPKGD